MSILLNTKIMSAENFKKSFVSTEQHYITTGSICSGGGASEESMKQLGFNESNHRNLFMCEWDDKVSDVYKMNFKSENYFKDFYKTDWEKVEKTHLHILFISTPCQEFSIQSGQRKGLDSEKGQLYIDALIQARKINPDKIINENVSSITSSGKHYSKIQKEDGSVIELNYIPNEKQLKKDNMTLLESEKNKYVYTSKFNPKLKIGRTLKIVEDILIKDFPDYNIYIEVLNTKDFNTPQNRSRFFLIMIKKTFDLGFKFPKQQPLTVKLSDLLEDSVDDSLFIKNRGIIKYPKREYKNPKQLNLYGEVLKKDGTISNHLSSKIIVTPIISPCLTTSNHTKIFHQDRVRKLSATEQKRLHGFSDDYLLPIDNYSLTSHIMGNTLSPAVMKELIKGVMFFDEYNHLKQPKNNSDYKIKNKNLVLVS